MDRFRFPEAQGLYDPLQEKDNCGIGLVAHAKGERSHGIVRDGLSMLERMSHRAGRGCDDETGDGAGILVALPHAFFRRVVGGELDVDLPESGRYGVGMIFLPRDPEERGLCKQLLEGFIAAQGQRVLGWRRVPTANDGIGRDARTSEPVVEQVFIEAVGEIDQDAFERQLLLIRKQAYHTIRESDLREVDAYYVCSLSSRTVVYKGQLTPEQLSSYYSDLRAPDFSSHVALVHARFSTNTFPSWSRAQPMRFMGHNGEINTLRGNVNRMRARQGVLKSSHFGPELKKIYPVIDPETSDSGIFDNVLELLALAGRSLPEAVMMMVPEAWENDEAMSPDRKAFYEYHACLMEPWDGPASIVFTDGRFAGGVLDRNGLRPSRFWVTDDDRVVLASEVGVLDLPAERITAKGRLRSGWMFLVDFEKGRLVADKEIKEVIAGRRPYRQWNDRQRIRLEDLPEAAPPGGDPETLLPRLRMFGYTSEHLDFVMRPMVQKGKDPTGSMGNDAPLAFLSHDGRLLPEYFKQLFAQVTNPPIDSTREAVMMSLLAPTGPEGNILESVEADAERVWIKHPVLTDQGLARLKELDHGGWKSSVIDITYPRDAGEEGLQPALDRICAEASRAIREGYRFIILSDRAAGMDRIPLSALLAVGAVHQHLVGSEERTTAGLLVETGEAREVHHFCTLLGYGADGINPYLAYEALDKLRTDGHLPGVSADEARSRYRDAIGSGILKVMAKMGISTLTGYKGAQIFEAVGLAPEVVERSFAGTPSRLKGVGFRELARDAVRRHHAAWPVRTTGRLPALSNPGQYHWRPRGEKHMWNPEAISAVRRSAQGGDRQSYEEFARLSNDDARGRCTIRSLLGLRTQPAIPVEEVEPAAEIVKRFSTGAMSFGALSKEAHETLAVAMNRIGGKSNSGEGGEDPVRFSPMANGDSRRSAIKQVASGRFGVTLEYLVNADQLQIKMAQGAKPGVGGELPGSKVSDEIARVRHTTPGVTLISPPPHHDIYSIEDLAQLIYDLRNANTRADVSVKLVAAMGVGAVAAGVAKAGADHILISGHDGGTGASPLTSIKHAGLPWELGISEVHQTLVMNDLRGRVRLETDGQMKTGRDVVIAALLGAEEFGFSTAPLISIGCIMMRKCHLNTCPVGVCTQDPELRARFSGQPEHVINYLFLVAEEARELMAGLGIRTMDELIGRADLLEANLDHAEERAAGLDLTPITTSAVAPRPGVAVHRVRSQSRGLDQVLDRKLISEAREALEHGRPVRVKTAIRNVDRTVGTLLSQEIVRRYGPGGIPDGAVAVELAGSAGQSFGAWLVEGVTLELEGDANDYVGKGLSGGRIIIRPPAESPFVAEEHVVLGNVALYGAIRGQAYFRGKAGERFCVRNSGAVAVVEGVGDHGCEYMTGGRAVILGATGRNFAAGMSGGVAYVWDVDGRLASRCNMELVELGGVHEADQKELRSLVEAHLRYTGSNVARRLLAEWEAEVRRFVKVIPAEYRRALERRKEQAQMEEGEKVVLTDMGSGGPGSHRSGAVRGGEANGAQTSVDRKDKALSPRAGDD